MKKKGRDRIETAIIHNNSNSDLNINNLEEGWYARLSEIKGCMRFGGSTHVRLYARHSFVNSNVTVSTRETRILGQTGWETARNASRLRSNGEHVLYKVCIRACAGRRAPASLPQDVLDRVPFRHFRPHNTRRVASRSPRIKNSDW